MDAEDLNVANILTSDFTEDRAEFEGRLNSLFGRPQPDLRDAGIP